MLVNRGLVVMGFFSRSPHHHVFSLLSWAFMVKMVLLFLVSFFSIAFFSPLVFSAIPNKFQTSLTVLDDANSPLFGDFNFTLSVFDSLIGGNQLFSVDLNNQYVTTQGKVSLNFLTDLNADRNYFLGVSLNPSDGSLSRRTLSPRVEWVKVAYAERARTAGDPDLNVVGDVNALYISAKKSYIISTDDQNDFIDLGTQGFVFIQDGNIASGKDRFVLYDQNLLGTGSNREVFGVDNGAIPKLYVGRPTSASSGYLSTNTLGLECAARGTGTCGLLISPAGYDAEITGQNGKNIRINVPTATTYISEDPQFKTQGFILNMGELNADSNNTFLVDWNSNVPTYSSALRNPLVWFRHAKTIRGDQNFFMSTINDVNGWWVDGNFTMHLDGNVETNNHIILDSGKKACLDSSCNTFIKNNSSNNFNLQTGSGTDWNFYDDSGLISSVVQTNRGGLTALGATGVDAGIGGGADEGFLCSYNSTGLRGMCFDSDGFFQQYAALTTGSVVQHYDSKLILESQFSGASGAGVMVRPTGTQNPFGIANSSSTSLVQWNNLGGYRILTDDQNDFIDEGTNQGFVFGHLNSLLTNKDRFVLYDFTAATNREVFGVDSAAIPKFYVGRPGSASSSYMSGNRWGLECAARGTGTCSYDVSPAGSNVLATATNKNMGFKLTTANVAIDTSSKTNGFWFDLDSTLGDSNNTFKIFWDGSVPTYASAPKNPFIWIVHDKTIPNDRNFMVIEINDVNGFVITHDFNVYMANDKFYLRNDGNMTMTSPNGTLFNCGVADTGVFQCT